MNLYLLMLMLVCLVMPTASKLTKPSACGTSIGCFAHCVGVCTFVISWQDVGTDVQFNMSLTMLGGMNGYWLAIGLSDDQIMGTDNVLECVWNGTYMAVQRSYNSHRYNSPLTNEGLSQSQGSFVDNVLSCSFKQSKTTSQDKLDLNTDWYMLVAHGKAYMGVKAQHGVDPLLLPVSSHSKVDFQSNKDISYEQRAVMVKAHGCLMVFAWVMCASIGILLARYYKPMWPNTLIRGENVWFAFHRFLMLLAVLACIVAFVVIFIYIGAWSKLPGASMWHKAHPILGVIVMILAIINPIMAFFRPDPISKRRIIFSWAHWFVGTCAHIIAGLNLIIGVTLAQASLPFYLMWILVAWYMYQMCVETFLQLYDCCFRNKARRYRDGTYKDPRGSRLKKIVLFVHVVIITAFTCVAIVIIAKD